MAKKEGTLDIFAAANTNDTGFALSIEVISDVGDVVTQMFDIF